MKKSIFILVLSLVWLSALSQHTLDITLGVGFTAVDVEGLVEKDESTGTIATDWGQLNFGIGGQFLFNGTEKISYGAELMYQYLYWYSVRIPYGSQTIYRDYSVAAFRITPMLRFNLSDAFAIDLGPEFNFSDGLVFGLLLSANYYIPVSENISVPIKLRLDPMFDLVVTVPVSVNAGIRIKL